MYAFPIPFSPLSKGICTFCDSRISFPETFSCPLSFSYPDKNPCFLPLRMEDIRPTYIHTKREPAEVQTTFPPLFFQNIFARRKKNWPLGLFSTNIQKTLFSKGEPRIFVFHVLYRHGQNGASPQHTKDSTLGLKKILKWEFYFQNKLNSESDLETFHLASRILADKSNHND
ncbi:hypothetical protein CDAR_392791 [Caerostris darwini]|uniref:Uncharacterized protein n=1 Tax=Caerostris darwini TaxID=1538125 RepID=A0AAV4S8V1_9ARAC|nr:hypothetical protein CDAR_392791 [Caerostris darwini]